MNELSLAMRKLAVGVGLALYVCGASAQTVTYHFYGAEGFNENHGPILAGELTLDLNAECNQSRLREGEPGWQSVYQFQEPTLFGSYGDWTFSGIVEVTVIDGPEFWSNGDENLAWDSWIARASITGPLFNDRQPVSISLFYYTSPAGITSSDLLIPYDPLMSPNAYDFQFIIEFEDYVNDGSQLVFGQLFTIQSVPEPTVGSLVMIGLGMLALARRQNQRQ